MSLPDDCDVEKIAEVAIALMYLTFEGSRGELRAWKGLDWDVLAVLHEKGWIGNPRTKARSVLVTETGGKQARLLFERHFKAKP